MPEKTSKIGRRSDSVCAATMGFQEVMNTIFSFMVSTTNGFVQNRGRASFNLATNKNQNYRTHCVCSDALKRTRLVGVKFIND